MNNKSSIVCYPCELVFDDRKSCLEHINSKSCLLGSPNVSNQSKILGLVCYSCKKGFNSKMDSALHLIYENCSNNSSIITEENSIVYAFEKMEI